MIIISLAPNQHIKMISEGSYDTKDWSNDTDHLLSNHRNNLHFKIYIYIYKKLFEMVIFYNNTVLLNF